MRSSLKIIYMLACCLVITTQAKAYDTNDDCAICQRLKNFQNYKKLLGKFYWPEFLVDTLSAPLFYYTKDNTYLVFPDRKVRARFVYSNVPCKNGMPLYKLNKRRDATPFHMENNMDLSDTASAYYRNPIMECSDVETAHSLIPDVEKTEEWMGMVTHEYFHSFQFKHPAMLNYLADSIRMSADTLNKIFFKYTWFKEQIINENDLLLKAVDAVGKDSTDHYIYKFIAAREARRKKFAGISGFNLPDVENFWEKIEGTARYMEYNLAYIFKDRVTDDTSNCDTLFTNYKDYRNGTMFNKPWITSKTKVQAPYFYVIGFNMCRFMDKAGIAYKEKLFDRNIGPYELLKKAYP